MDENRDRPAPPPPLDYATPGGPSMPFALQVVLGFAAFLAFLVLTFLTAAGLSRVGASFGLTSLVLFGGLVALTVSLHTRKRWSGFTAGVLLGLGLSILAVGICFVVVMRSFRAG